jgi:L-amino acid N-acyltransferase YncA
MPIIRPSRDEDIAAISAIYAHYVLHGTGTFELAPPSPADMQARRAEVLARGLPWLVAEDQGQVLGYAYCNWFRPRPAYRYAVEDSIYLTPQACGLGLGRSLLAELLSQAERAGMRKMIAVIGDSGNAASIGLHRSCGFTPAGVLTSSGWKFGRWLDTVLMEKALGRGDSMPPGASPTIGP